MEFDELLVTTKVDALVRLVREKGSLEIQIAAKLLDVDSETVEEWAHILEEEGIVKIDYHLTKVHITWVQPTQEAIKEEKEEFYKQKTDVSQEIAELKAQMNPKERELETLKADFDKIYEKISPQIEKLQKQLDGISHIKETKDDSKEKGIIKLEILTKRIEEVTSALEELKEELKGTKKELQEKSPVQTRLEGVERLKKELSDLGDRLKETDQKISTFQKTLSGESKQSPDAVKKEVDSLKRDFAELRRVNGSIKDNLFALKESLEVLDTIEKTIGDREKRADGLKGELQQVLSSLKTLQNQEKELSERVKIEINAIDGFKESLDFVKSATSRLPAQKEMLAKLAELENGETILGGRIAALEKATSGTSTVPGITVKDLTRLKEELDERRKMISEEVKELFSAVEEESATYSTFQTIKEKALETIEEYSNKIKTMNEELRTLDSESKKIKEELEKEEKSIASGLDDNVLKGIMKDAEEVEGKKELLDEIAESLEALESASESISKKINLLSKEAEILSIRSGGTTLSPQTKEVTPEKENELRQQLNLTKNEQQEFDAKREQLRDLIKKLWEDSETP